MTSVANAAPETVVPAVAVVVIAVLLVRVATVVMRSAPEAPAPTMIMSAIGDVANPASSVVPVPVTALAPLVMATVPVPAPTRPTYQLTLPAAPPS